MLRIVVDLLLLLYQGVISQSQIDFDWDHKMMMKDLDYKCGIENKFKSESTVSSKAESRIINGKRISSVRYPWMTEVLLLIPKSDGTPEFTGLGVGSIISDKSILTVNYNLCLPPYNSLEPSVVTCLEESTGTNKLQNQNREENQVHYSIGVMDIFDDQRIEHMLKNYNSEFKRDVKAFMYKYEPKWWDEGSEQEKKRKRKQYKNGDFGLIINEIGLSLKPNKAIPICLPSPRVFKKENMEDSGSGFDVTIVGRGKVYDENESSTKTSCMTNEGMVKKRFVHYQEIFLQCKDYDRTKPRDTCLNLRDAEISKDGRYKTGYKSSLLSVHAKIKFVATSGRRSRKLEVEIPKNDKCEALSQKVNDALNKLEDAVDIQLKGQNEPSRIVVFDNDEKVTDWKEVYWNWKTHRIGKHSPDVPYCYNLRKLYNWHSNTKFGICETDNDIYNFGFCSPSCKENQPFSDPTRKGYYWKMDAKYYEFLDDTFNVFKSKFIKI